MPIPDFQTVMLPLLESVANRQPHSTKEVVAALAKHFELSDSERAELLPSGRYPLFNNRVAWALSHMKNAGLLTSPSRSMYVLTDRGAALLAQQPGRVDMKLLAQFPEYIEFRNRRKEPTTTDAPGNPVLVDAGEEQTPNEAIEIAYQKLRFELVDELLQQIKGASPEFFERLVVELLLRMGYGGSRSDAGRAIGKSGDGGIDGIIKEDRLGLDIIYIQAKKWDSTIGRPEIQKFAGALQGQRARKGVFITTSDFSQQARDYVALIDSKIVLIDGEQLAQFMMDHNLGVSTVASYEVKRVDSDYFDS